MSSDDCQSILAKQHAFFAKGLTQSIDFRIKQLHILKSILQQHEDDIVDALKKDLHKSKTESILNEILIIIKEIHFAIKHLKKWSRPKKVKTPFILWPARSAIYVEPYGSVFIIGAWNYPLMLIASPLIGAISAGNCVVIKPSELSTHTEKLMIQLINQYFPPEYIIAISCDAEETKYWLNEKFDYIFFTGSPAIGKKIMAAAAKHLTPITLELGGKNPCIVDETADLQYTARRIVWAKMMNAGQTCLAPDYLYIHHACKDQLITMLIQTIRQFYSDHPDTNIDYGRIINQKHFERLVSLMQKGHIIYGGQHHEDHLYIAPTLIDHVTWQDPIMQEEIFGPILPIFYYHDLNDVILQIKQHAKPLALYLFTKQKKIENKIVQDLSFGGGCINDCILHLINPHLPFGGIGQSGMGAYHGQYSFETFSHKKSIYKKLFSMDIPLVYPPFSKQKLWWIKQCFKR